MARKRLKEVAGDKMPLRLVWAEAGSIARNPRNWRRHPEGQMESLRALMRPPEEGGVGFAGALLFNERLGRLVDGHGRLECLPRDAVVPVLVGSWSEREEATILATLDPLAAMAEVDHEALASLCRDIDLKPFGAISDEVGRMMHEVAAQMEDQPEPAGEAPDPDGGQPQRGEFRVLALCESEAQQGEVYDLLTKHGVKCRVLTTS